MSENYNIMYWNLKKKNQIMGISNKMMYKPPLAE